MSNEDDMAAYADAAAALLRLPIAPAHRPGVLRNLQMVAALAPRVLNFELGPADESGNVFRPVEPGADSSNGSAR